MFVGFFILRIFFNILYKYRLSIFLRLFDFWAYFFIILFEGNIQQFAFYMISELRNLFAFTFNNWIVKVLVVQFGFILGLVATACFFMTLGLYGKLNRYLLYNYRNSMMGNIVLMLQFGLRNLVLGIMHSLLRELSYSTTITVLIGTEIVFMVIFTLSIPWKIYKSINNMWIYLLLTFIRIILISTLLFDN